MAVLSLILSPWAPLALVLGVVVSYMYHYFVTYRQLRGIPAPFPAQFSDLWLMRVCRRGNRYSTVHELHQKLGPVVRIQPNHVSICDDEAIQQIYGHGNGFLKSSVSLIPAPSHLPTLTRTPVPAPSTTPSSASSAASSTRATVPSTRASARSSPTPSPPSRSSSSSPTFMATSPSSSHSGTTSSRGPRRARPRSTAWSGSTSSPLTSLAT